MYPGTRVITPPVHAIAAVKVPLRRRLALLLPLLGLLLPPQLAHSADADHFPGEVLVKFRAEATVLGVEQALAARPGQRLIAEGLHRVGIRPGETVEQVILELEALPEIEYAEPDYLRRVQQLSPPNDPFFGSQWALHNTGQTLPVPQGFPGQPGADISALEAWTITTGSHDVVVAVVDTGIDRNHPELSANLWSDVNGNIGRDYVSGGNDPHDAAGHGTRMSGIIGARGGNGIGMAGVAWEVSLMALRAFNEDGEGRCSNIAAAFDFARLNGARIINASFGANRFCMTEYQALQRADAAGVLVVASACNQGEDNDASNGQQPPCYPASYNLPNIISVAATDNGDGLLASSNYGANSVHLGAPGQNILTTDPLNGRAVDIAMVYVSGTSAAAALVSGAAALLLARNPDLDAVLLREALLENVDPAPNLVGRTITGGRLNVARALDSEAALAQAASVRLPAAGGSGASGRLELLSLILCAALLAGARGCAGGVRRTLRIDHDWCKISLRSLFLVRNPPARVPRKYSTL
jgi:subtilisin family serine protease